MRRTERAGRTPGGGATAGSSASSAAATAAACRWRAPSVYGWPPSSHPSSSSSSSSSPSLLTSLLPLPLLLPLLLPLPLREPRASMRTSATMHWLTTLEPSAASSDSGTAASRRAGCARPPVHAATGAVRLDNRCIRPLLFDTPSSAPADS
eukprot:363701-Chlamydomonas_euryale.AAC.1